MQFDELTYKVIAAGTVEFRACYDENFK